ncbi:hypothetical protein KR032_011576 [Drosophila birchii]|nr:hypothetical protein KR032_011576 [Drosophila birchii]
MLLTHGITLGWFSPSLQLFYSDKNPFGEPLTTNQASTAGSIVAIGSLLTVLILGWLLEFFGRKMVMYAAAVCNVINWILVYFGGHVACLYVARMLVGACGGTLLIVLPIYIAEIADKNVRGTLTSMPVLAMCSGIALGLIMASYIPYFVFPFIAGAMGILYVLVIIPLPETPQFLLKRGHDAKAEKSFYFYKNLKSKSSNDPTKDAEAEAEFKTFRENVFGGEKPQKPTCRDFCNKTALKAFVLIKVLVLCNAFSGGFSILNYASEIFSNLGSKMDPNTSANLAGIFQLLGIFCAVLLVDRVGRRWLLIPSLVGTGLGELTVALLMSFATKKFLSDTDWLGVSLICFVEYMVSLGAIPLTYTIIVELLPVKIISLGAAFSGVIHNVLMFLVLLLYPWLICNHGLASAMYTSAATCFFGAIVLGIFLPETKGKLIL